jgi:hypothetical protein
VAVVLGTVWGWITAAIGAITAALLVAYGTDSGTWVDEQHISNAPSVLGLLIVTALAILLFAGGLIVGLVGTAGHRRRRTAPPAR